MKATVQRSNQGQTANDRQTNSKQDFFQKFKFQKQKSKVILFVSSFFLLSLPSLQIELYRFKFNSIPIAHNSFSDFDSDQQSNLPQDDSVVNKIFSLLLLFSFLFSFKCVVKKRRRKSFTLTFDLLSYSKIKLQNFSLQC